MLKINNDEKENIEKYIIYRKIKMFLKPFIGIMSLMLVVFVFSFYLSFFAMILPIVFILGDSAIILFWTVIELNVLANSLPAIL